MKIGLMMCLCFIVTISQAQDYKKDFLQVYKNYSTKAYYTQEVRVRSFANEGDKKASYEQQGKIVKGEGMYFSSLGDQTTIVKEGHFLHINKEEKRMLFYYQKEGNNQIAEQYRMLLDSIKETDIEYLGNSNGIKKYLLKSPNQMIATTELSLDMNKNVVARLVYHYQSTEAHQSSFYKTIITYKTDDRNKPTASWFDLEQYIHLNKNRATLKTAYKEYTLTQPQEETKQWKGLPK
ncbi:MAG: hypothetical protein ACRBFS_17445 [Aureispira sp.]